MVNRSGTAGIAEVETVGGATDPEFARAVAAGADTVYFCLNAPSYHRWPEEFPPTPACRGRRGDIRVVIGACLGLHRPGRAYIHGVLHFRYVGSDTQQDIHIR